MDVNALFGNQSALSGIIPASTLYNITDPYTIVHGYIGSPHQRSAAQVIYSCMVTISLCCWVSTFPNVPGPRDKWYHPSIDKLNMACIGLLGPEFLFVIAMGQLSSAMRSVRTFKYSKHLTNGLEWTLQHGFFADMGGFQLCSPDYPFGFPINAEQFHFLIKNGYIDFPDMDLVAIDEKNSTEVFSRLLATVSAIWFFSQEFMHLAEGNPISLLELTGMTFAIVMVSTSICWYHKPCIQKAYCVNTKDGITVKQIRRASKRAGHEFYRDKWYRTPLEFIGNRKFTVSNHWAYYVRLSQKFHVPIFSRAVNSRPWDRWPSDTFQAPEPLLFPLAGFVCASFSASFLIAWNFYFPTWLEQTIWRACAVYNGFFACFGSMYFLIETMRFHWNLEGSLELEGRIRNGTDDPAAHGEDVERHRSFNIRWVVRIMTGGLVDADGKAAAIRSALTEPVVECEFVREKGKVSNQVGPDHYDSDLEDCSDCQDCRDFAKFKAKFDRKNGDKDLEEEHDDPDTSSLSGRLAAIGHSASFSIIRHGTSMSLARTASTVSSFDRGSIDENDNEIPQTTPLRYLKHLTAILHGLTPYSDPNMSIPLRVLFPVSFLCLFYMIARCCFWVLDFYSLREQPVGVYFDNGFDVF